jgi:hypothetical protein
MLKSVMCGEDIVADATQRSLNGIADCRALHRAPAGSWRPDVARANPALHHSTVQGVSAATPAGPGNQQEFVAVHRAAANQMRAGQRRPFDQEQGLLWSGRLPCAFASASVMY